jgi:hypothetical protein
MYLPDYLKEPNNLFGMEYCAGANASEMTGGMFGWSDERCTVRAPYMCKVTRESGQGPCCCSWGIAGESLCSAGMARHGAGAIHGEAV